MVIPFYTPTSNVGEYSWSVFLPKFDVSLLILAIQVWMFLTCISLIADNFQSFSCAYCLDYMYSIPFLCVWKTYSAIFVHGFNWGLCCSYLLFYVEILYTFSLQVLCQVYVLQTVILYWWPFHSSVLMTFKEQHSIILMKSNISHFFI